MTRMLKTLTLAALLGLLGSCGGGDLGTQAGLRMIQASPDAPLVNFLLKGVAYRPNVDYAGGTGFTLLSPTNYDISFQGNLPNRLELLADPIDMPLAAGHEYTALLIGKVANGTNEVLLIDNVASAVTAGDARVEIVHAAPDAPTVDIYLTAPGASLPASTPITQLSYKQVNRQEIAAGTYEVRVTPAGLPDTVLYDSGNLTLNAGTDLLVVAIENTGAGQAPLALIVNTGISSAGILDIATPSDIRVINTSPDAPALDVTADPATASEIDVVLADGLAYLGNTGYIGLPPDTYTVRAVSAVDPASTLIQYSRDFIVGLRTTFLATDVVASINELVLTDDIRSVATEGKIRIIDSSLAGNVVDVYIARPGIDIAAVNPTLQGLVLQSATGYLVFDPADYTVTFTTAGTRDVLATAEVPATAGRVFTAILVDAPRPTAESDGKPLGVMLIDDRLPVTPPVPATP